MERKLFGTDGIRGTANIFPVTAELAMKVGMAAGTYFGKRGDYRHQVVIAKDTPNFIANRIGTYAMLGAMAGLEQGLTIEEVDALTGPLTGRPKSATFRTADVVGLDTLAHVCRNLYAAIPHDPARERFRLPALLEKLIENKIITRTFTLVAVVDFIAFSVNAKAIVSIKTMTKSSVRNL